MASLRDNEKRIDLTLRKWTRTTERELAQSYRAAYRNIRAELARLYDKYAKEGKLTYSEMAKYNRLKTMYKQVKEEVEPDLKRGTQAIKLLSEEQYQAAFYRYGWAIEQDVGADLSYGLINKDTARAAVQNPVSGLTLNETLSQHRRQVVAGIRRHVTVGLIQGDSYPRMMRRVREGLEGNSKKAMRIVRTEGQRSAVRGQMDTYDHAEEAGVDLDRIWDATLDDRVREKHAALDGRKAVEDKGWYVAGIGWVSAPLQSGVASFDIHCFPGDTKIMSPYPVDKLYRRFYEGILIDIVFESGLELSVTPNHPILTKDGWRAAQLMEARDDVLCAGWREELLEGNEYIDYEPSMIKEIYNFVSIWISTDRILGLDQQFHGDGGGSEVDVISLYGILRDHVDTAPFSNPISQNEFAIPDFAQSILFGSSGFDERSDINLSASNSIMGSFSKAVTFLLWGSTHPCIHSQTTISEMLAAFEEYSTYNLTANTEMFGKLFDGNPVSITLDKIASIDIRDFSGQVYNLSTQNEWYAGYSNTDTTITQYPIMHNCRCRVRAQIEGYEPKFRRVRGEGIVENKTYNQWAGERGIKI